MLAPPCVVKALIKSPGYARDGGALDYLDSKLYLKVVKKLRCKRHRLSVVDVKGCCAVGYSNRAVGFTSIASLPMLKANNNKPQPYYNATRTYTKKN